MNIKKFFKLFIIGTVTLLIFVAISRNFSVVSDEPVPKVTPTTNSQKLTEDRSNKDKVPLLEDKFTLGSYDNCEVHSRSNMNTSSMPGALRDKSDLICENNGEKQILFEVLDKPGFLDAKNSIYRVWTDNEGYKALLVDQNGAGSGEGNAKIILLKNNGYKLLTCFYFQAPEGFSYKYYGAITTKEMANINHTDVTDQISSSAYCDNFTLKNYFN